MKLNKFFILVAAISSFTSGVMYSWSPTLNSIIRMERFEKPGYATVDLLHDVHAVHPEQEAVIIKAFTERKGHVYVEDLSEYVGGKHIQNNLCRLPQITGYIVGLANRLRKEGISASSVECRSGLFCDKSTSEQVVIADYKKIREGLKADNSVDHVDIWSNTIIKSIEKNEDALLKKGLGNNFMQLQLEVGGQTLEMLALKALCKKDENSYKAFVAGSAHCEGVGLSLDRLGYTRTKCLENEEQNSIAIHRAYYPFLPSFSKYISFVIRGRPPLKTLSEKPLNPHQIKDYFEKPNSYKTS